MNKLLNYFSEGVLSKDLEKVGMEVETQFVNAEGKPITRDTSQKMFTWLAAEGWRVRTVKNGLLTCLVDNCGNTFSYELGRQNIELSGAALTPNMVLENTKSCLSQLYKAGEVFGSFPLFSPILKSDEELLVIPDERDENWLKLDGKDSLEILAKTSSIQFTVSVSLKNALGNLNKFGQNIDWFLCDYPQEKEWKKYIETSLAGYRSDRYGGPLLFESLNDYCDNLVKQDVVVGSKLIDFRTVESLDILDTPLFLRSVWWYFRLKRYGPDLCIEVRPMPRRSDDKFEEYLKMVLEIMSDS